MDGSEPRYATTLTVYGRPRPAANFVAAALARSLDPAPVCLEVREAASPSGEVAEAIARRIGVRRTFVAHPPEQLAPAAGGRPDVWKVVGPEESGAVVERLDAFLRLPEAVQRLWTDLGPGRSRVLLVLNSDRLADAYPYGEEAQRTAYAFFREEGVSLVTSRTGELAAEGRVEEHLFRVTPHPDNDWTMARVTTMRGSRWHFDDQPLRGVPLFQEFFRVLGLRNDL